MRQHEATYSSGAVFAREGAPVVYRGERHVVLLVQVQEAQGAPMTLYRTVLLSDVPLDLHQGDDVKAGDVLGSAPSYNCHCYDREYTTYIMSSTWTPYMTHPDWGCLDIVYAPWFYKEMMAQQEESYGASWDRRAFDHVFEDGKVQFMAAGAMVFEHDLFLPRARHASEEVHYIPYSLEGMQAASGIVWYQRLLLSPEWKRRSELYLRAHEHEQYVAPRFLDPPTPTWRERAASWGESAADWIQEAADKLRGKS